MENKAFGALAFLKQEGSMALGFARVLLCSLISIKAQTLGACHAFRGASRCLGLLPLKMDELGLIQFFSDLTGASESTARCVVIYLDLLEWHYGGGGWPRWEALANGEVIRSDASLDLSGRSLTGSGS